MSRQGHHPRVEQKEEEKKGSTRSLARSVSRLTIYLLLLPLLHNPGTELEKGEPYHNGNKEPKGFGHIGISVPSLEAAVAHFDKCKVKFVKRPEEGSMRDIAFIQDPDGYWIEVIQADLMRQFAAGA